MDDRLSDDSSDWSSAEELEDWTQDLSQTLCLFCSKTFKSNEESFVHLKSDHNLDFIDICIENQFNSYDFIKFINYLRINKPKSCQIIQLIESKHFQSKQYMKPVLSDDPLLTYDIESQTTDCNNHLMANKTIDSNYEELSPKQLIHKLKQSEDHIKALETQLSEMKGLVKNCLSEDMSRENEVNVKDLSVSEDSYYISSYSHFSIHYDMLSDKSRTKSYEDVILKNHNYFKDKTVLDIGCGTGILSLFAAKAGAELVVAVDQSDVIYKAMDIAIENGFNSKIKFIKSKVESIDFEAHGLPQKYDIIVSEWMGYCLLFEGMLDSILYARNHFMSDSGVLLPNQCSISMAGISDHDLKNRFIDFWDNVYGFQMSSMKKEILSEAHIESVSKDVINTNVFVVKRLDLMQCLCEETQRFETDFQLICISDEPLVAIVGWFDVMFNIESFEHKLNLSTDPFSEPTHWKQTVFLLKRAIICKIGDKIEGNIKMYRNVKDIRSLIVEIEINSNPKQVFYLS